jgi:hypothetical protein
VIDPSLHESQFISFPVGMDAPLGAPLEWRGSLFGISTFPEPTALGSCISPKDSFGSSVLVSTPEVSSVDFRSSRLTARPLVGFLEPVEVYFFDQESDEPCCQTSRCKLIGKVKSFDGRSDTARGCLCEEQIGGFIRSMSRRGGEYDESDEEEVMSRDLHFSQSFISIKNIRRRNRLYADEWDSVSDIYQTSNESHLDDDYSIEFMENTPCDCDIDEKDIETDSISSLMTSDVSPRIVNDI